MMVFWYIFEMLDSEPVRLHPVPCGFVRPIPSRSYHQENGMEWNMEWSMRWNMESDMEAKIVSWE